MTSPSELSKTALRKALLHLRSKLTAGERETAAERLLTVALQLPELARARTIAAYVSIGSEPDTRALIETLSLRGVRVLLPVLLEDNDLDWAEYDGLRSLTAAVHPTSRGTSKAGRLSLMEPTGPRLGTEAVTAADVVLLPGVAVDGQGQRLGRGGGSYDRVLARLERARSSAALVVLLYPNEIVPSVPTARHDRAVDAAVTPDGTHRFTRR